MNENIFEKISTDEEFAKRIANQTTDQGLKDTLAEKDIEVSLEEAKKIREKISSILSGETKLTEEELAIINGGAATVGDAIKYTVCTAVSIAAIVTVAKFGIDVAANVDSKETNKVKEGFKGWTGFGKDNTTWGRAVEMTSNLIINKSK